MQVTAVARLVVSATATAAFTMGPVGFAAAADPPVTLSVSTPGAPLAVQPGYVTESWVRVTNAGPSPLPVVISPATVSYGDNGATSLRPGADPRFAGRITIDRPAQTVPARGYLTVPVHIAVPMGLAPDIYLVGFLITPTVNGAGSVRVVNQIGAFIAIDLPGPRDRRMVATVLHADTFAFTAHPSLTVRAQDTGDAALQFTTETTVGGYGRATPSDVRGPPLLLPAGHYRDVAVGWHAKFGIGYYHVRVVLVYHKTDAQTEQIVLTRTVIALAPATAAILGALLITAAVTMTVLARRRRRRSAAVRQPTGRHARGRAPVPGTASSRHRRRNQPRHATN